MKKIFNKKNLNLFTVFKFDDDVSEYHEFILNEEGVRKDAKWWFDETVNKMRAKNMGRKHFLKVHISQG